MGSKAEWLRNKRIKQRIGAGRPRKEGERYPSGDIKRSETEKEAMSVALAARMRIHGIEDRDQRAGYTLGRMHLDRKITDHELEAGNWYTEHMARYYASNGIGFPSVRAQNLFAVRGYDGEETETMQERSRKATNMMMKLEGLLLKCTDGPQVKLTVRSVCLEDVEGLRMMPDHQLSLLKRGLQALMFAKGVAG